MRILFGTDNFYPNVNGSANFAYELAKGLVRRGHQISVIAPARRFANTKTKRDGLTIYGIRSVMLPKIIYPGGFRIPLTIQASYIKKAVSEANPDIIHLHDHFIICSKLLNISRKIGLPIVGTNHFMPENLIHYLYPPDFAKKPLSKLAWRQFINVYKHLYFITGPTKAAINLLKNLRLKNPMTIISCGIDLKRFTPQKKADHAKHTILFVGRLDKEKNIDVIIKALPNILKFRAVQLIIAGKGKEQSNLINLAKQLKVEKNITFTGFVPEKDLPSLYSSADCFVIASYAELQSIATMEAMASGLPIVAARVMALPELVHDGENGYLFKQGDSYALAKNVLRILENPTLRKKMSENSLKIISKHTIENTIKKFEDLYKLVCKNKFSII